MDLTSEQLPGDTQSTAPAWANLQIPVWKGSSTDAEHGAEGPRLSYIPDGCDSCLERLCERDKPTVWGIEDSALCSSVSRCRQDAQLRYKNPKLT